MKPVIDINMKKICFYLFSIFALTIIPLRAEQENDEPLRVHVGTTQYTRVGLKLIGIGQDPDLTTLIEILKKDLMYSGQFMVSETILENVPKRSFFMSVAKEGYPLTLIIEKKDGDVIHWRLYDTALGQMVKGLTHPKKGTTLRGWAHGLADILWPELTGNVGFFSTKIAYCKAVQLPHKKAFCRYVYIADYDGSDPQLLVKTPTINMGLRWNRDPKKPLLFYSEYTNKNVRLMSVDMKRKRRVASSFDGINMLPTFSGDGKRAIYCASRADGNCHLYSFEKHQLKRVLGTEGNHVSPTLSADGSHMYFCSDYETGKPRIYRYDFDTQKITPISGHGSAMAPCYSSANKKVVYSKFAQGVVQLFCYDEATGKDIQITSDSGNKEEASWSPCGNYVMYVVEHKGKGRVVHLNMLTKEQRYITDENSNCSYPNWSDRYDQFPVLSK